MKQLSGLDASFLYLETRSAPMHLTGVALYDPTTAAAARVDFERIVENTAARLNRSPIFRRRLARVPLNLDHPYWVEEPDVDVLSHMQHLRLAEPGDERALCALAAQLHAEPLDLSRPLWEMIAVEGVDRVPGLPRGSFALVPLRWLSSRP